MVRGTTLTDWTVYTLPLDNLDRLGGKFRSAAALGRAQGAGYDVAREGPAFYRGTFTLDAPAAGLNAAGTLPDTYARVGAWGKGLVWVNGVNLGWYWPSAGPQLAQYVPGPILKDGKNEVVLLEVEASPAGAPEVELVDTPDFYGRVQPTAARAEVAAASPEALPDFSRAQYLPPRQRAAYEAAVAAAAARAPTAQ